MMTLYGVPRDAYNGHHGLNRVTALSVPFMPVLLPLLHDLTLISGFCT